MIGEGTKIGTGYTRADTSNNISDGNVINASDFDAEYDAIEAAFNATTGHTHDGTAAEGGPITVVGPAQDVTVSGSAVVPKADNTYDLGSSSFEWKDLYVDGVANIDSLVADTADINGGTIDGAVIGGSTPAAGTFTTLTANGNVTLGDATSDTITVTGRINSNVLPSTDGTRDLGSSSLEWKDLYVDGVAHLDDVSVDGNFTMLGVTNVFRILDSSGDGHEIRGGGPGSIACFEVNSGVTNLSNSYFSINPGLLSSFGSGVGRLTLQDNVLSMAVTGGDIQIRSGTGSPNGVVSANPGTLYINLSGGAGTTLYVKESGTGNTGWVAK